MAPKIRMSWFPARRWDASPVEVVANLTLRIELHEGLLSGILPSNIFSTRMFQLSQSPYLPAILVDALHTTQAILLITWSFFLTPIWLPNIQNVVNSVNCLGIVAKMGGNMIFGSPGSGFPSVPVQASCLTRQTFQLLPELSDWKRRRWLNCSKQNTPPTWDLACIVYGASLLIWFLTRNQLALLLLQHWPRFLWYRELCILQWAAAGH